MVNSTSYEPSFHHHFSSCYSLQETSSDFPCQQMDLVNISAQPSSSNGSSINPLIVRPVVHYPMPFTGVTQPQALSFSSVPLSERNYINFGIRDEFSVNDKKKKTDANARITKVAKTNRKIAKHRKSHLHTSASSTEQSVLLPYYYYKGIDSSIYISMHDMIENSGRIPPPLDPYSFIALDNKRFKLVLKKELKPSDLCNFGRILLPKKEAEQNLPGLTTIARDGVQLVVRDLKCEQEWTFKYKYWINNKGRIYLLENTGDFARKNCLEVGDILILYEDKSRDLYFSIKKVERPLHEILQRIPEIYDNLQWSSFQDLQESQTHEEEQASFALLMEQFLYNEQQEVTLHLLEYPSSST